MNSLPTPTNSIMLADYQDLEGIIKTTRAYLPRVLESLIATGDTLGYNGLYKLMQQIDNHLES